MIEASRRLVESMCLQQVVIYIYTIKALCNYQGVLFINLFYYFYIHYGLVMCRSWIERRVCDRKPTVELRKSSGIGFCRLTLFVCGP